MCASDCPGSTDNCMGGLAYGALAGMPMLLVAVFTIIIGRAPLFEGAMTVLVLGAVSGTVTIFSFLAWYELGGLKQAYKACESLYRELRLRNDLTEREKNVLLTLEGRAAIRL
jgi:hypothetical protein